MKNISRLPAILAPLLFTIAYTATVLPFTVSFFKHIANPSVTTGVLLPLIEAHTLLMPVFLAALEFTSVWLISRFWTENKDRWVALALFTFCQCLPASSVYFDCRNKDYLAEKAHFEQQKMDLTSATKIKISGIKERITAINNDIGNLKSDRETNSTAIRQIIQSKRKRLDDSLQMEVRSNINLRQKREDEMTAALESKIRLIKELASEEKNLADTAQSQLPHRSDLEYIAANIFTVKSFVSAFISALFPVSLLGVGFVLTRKSTTNNNNPSFDLDCHLEKVVASLPEGMHGHYAKSLLPPLEAHLSVFKASREILIENNHLHMTHGLIRNLVDEVQHISDQAAASKLEEGAKNHLIASLKEILERNLFPKEVSNHV